MRLLERGRTNIKRTTRRNLAQPNFVFWDQTRPRFLVTGRKQFKLFYKTISYETRLSTKEN